ncbi:SymE family type I addiction module toxin [Larkinella terrae]|uniref:Type I addiction module toxin, SymE family n=1 Tax=Larkinella terrae TaxID=2025311 RepID=A0A7K0EJC9_9BACT|nr:SymE family type I addiction module toxin [Larkinella terrae]MRS61894.1 type I addiction module toxin, SymE family [Larkinella terrae]
MKVRKIGYQQRKKHRWTIRQQTELVPSLLLAGKWMTSAGFSRGDSVKVWVEHNKIVIER